MEGITYFRGHVSLGSSWRWDFLTHPLCFTASAFVRSTAVSYFVEHPSTGVSLRSSSWLDWGHGLGEAAEPTSRSHRIPPGHPVSVLPRCEVGLELPGRGFVPFLHQKLLSWPLFHPVDPAWPVSLLRPGLSLWADGHWSVLGLGRQALAVPPPRRILGVCVRPAALPCSQAYLVCVCVCFLPRSEANPFLFRSQVNLDDLLNFTFAPSVKNWLREREADRPPSVG